MSEAPVRIWATVNGARTRYDLNRGEPSSVARERYVIGGWQSVTDDSPRATEYVRADIVEELRAALEECAEARMPGEARRIARLALALSRLAEVSNG